MEGSLPRFWLPECITLERTTYYKAQNNMLTIYGELDASPSSIWNKEAVSPSHDGIGDSGERFTRNSFFTPNKCKDSDLTGTGGWVAPRNHPSLTILESHIQRCGEGHVGQGPMAIQPYLDFIWFFSMVGEVAGWFFGITSPAIGIGHFEGAMVFRKLDGWMDGWMDRWMLHSKVKIWFAFPQDPLSHTLCMDEVPTIIVESKMKDIFHSSNPKFILRQFRISACQLPFLTRKPKLSPTFNKNWHQVIRLTLSIPQPSSPPHVPQHAW